MWSRRLAIGSWLVAQIPANLATVEDVEARMGRPLEEAEQSLAGVLVNDAARMILARIPDLQTRLEDERLDHESVVMVQANAVCRVLRNPDGYRSEQAGSFSYQVDTRAAAGFLMILAEEWTLLGARGSSGVAPATDGYLAGRTSIAPDLWFQSGWPARDSMAERGFW
ncbi:hypothetical protein 7S3_7 [uncultured Caudovirales phage]|uniref:Uncharacterized protein n=1 Tax=uncultured Caudovirales phage TaxID=2100421 RepID=A0A2H4J276_9CAUD|nr:hypothetical protein 7S3_7 [uncultured Caudovirales phage]